MKISVMLTSLPLDFVEAAAVARDLGFGYIDVVARGERHPTDCEALAETGLVVCCAAVGRGLAEGQSLETGHLAKRAAALDEVKRQLADAAHLGATHAYVVPGLDASPTGLARFGETCTALADYAAARM